MKHSAWLSATPEKAKESRYKTLEKQSSVLLEMPPVDLGAYLIEVLFDVGPVQPLGMGGHVAISEQELLAWQINRGVKLSSWECETVKRLSSVYAGMLVDAREMHCPPPYVSPSVPTSENRDKVAQGFKRLALARKKGRRHG